MRHLYLCLALVCLTFSARAQSGGHLPLFRFGFIYQYTEAGTAGDTTHTLRMAFPHINFPDSVARLSGRAVALTRNVPGCYTSHVQRPDGLFGATVVISYRSSATTEYTLRGYNGRTFLFKPGAALNQPWTATAAGLTARVTARGAATTFGQPDVVSTITLSDGETIRYSQQWGYLEGPNLGAYLNGQRRRRLTLTAITGQGLTLGQPAVGGRAMHDYQPGDVFLRYSQQYGTQTGSTCSESWVRDSVLTRATNAAGDLVYSVQRRTLTRNYGSPSAPAPFCQNTPGTTLSPAQPYTLTVSATDETQLGLLTHTLGGSTINFFRPLTLAGVRITSYNGRKTQQTLTRQVCQPTTADSTLMGDILDNGSSTTYAAGLGAVTASTFGIYTCQTSTLLGYRKVNLPTATGVETWGTLRTFANILKAADHRPASTTAAFPNPFVNELTVRFETQRAQAVTLRLYNALGQLVHQQSRSAGAGAQQLTLAVPTLSAGLYSLHLLADGRTQVLKLAAGQ